LALEAGALLNAAGGFHDAEELQRALRDLLARGELARTAARLACVCKASRNVLRESGGDLIGIAGAARWAQATALSRIVRMLAACVRLREAAPVSARLVALCDSASDAATPANPAHELQTAMVGISLEGPTVAASLAGVVGFAALAELTANAAAGWLALAGGVDHVLHVYPGVLMEQPTAPAMVGAPFAGPMVMGALAGFIDGTGQRVRREGAADADARAAPAGGCVSQHAFAAETA
jgi:hypothetical protein